LGGEQPDIEFHEIEELLVKDLGGQKARREVPLAALTKIKLKMQKQALFGEVWNSNGTNARKDVSVWQPGVQSDIAKRAKGRKNREQVCLGFFANASLAPPGKERKAIARMMLEVTDTGVALGVKSSPYLDSVIARLLPHPVRMQQVWNQQQGARGSFFAWRPIPPSADFVAVGMVASTTEDPPPLDCVHCVPRRWVTKAKKPPKLLWDDAGTAGRQGSIWTINALGLIAVTPGHAPPDEEFFDFVNPRFYLEPEDAEDAGGAEGADGGGGGDGGDGGGGDGGGGAAGPPPAAPPRPR
jgi:hypothetical protein